MARSGLRSFPFRPNEIRYITCAYRTSNPEAERLSSRLLKNPGWEATQIFHFNLVGFNRQASVTRPDARFRGGRATEHLRGLSPAQKKMTAIAGGHYSIVAC